MFMYHSPSETFKRWFTACGDAHGEAVMPNAAYAVKKIIAEGHYATRATQLV
jgi:hypothetical protein